MTPAETIEAAYRGFVNAYGDDEGACSAVVEALVDAGLCTDDATGEASLEARVERVVREFYWGADAWDFDCLGLRVAEALGLAEVHA